MKWRIAIGALTAVAVSLLIISPLSIGVIALSVAGCAGVCGGIVAGLVASGKLRVGFVSGGLLALVVAGLGTGADYFGIMGALIGAVVGGVAAVMGVRVASATVGGVGGFTYVALFQDGHELTGLLSGIILGWVWGELWQWIGRMEGPRAGSSTTTRS